MLEGLFLGGWHADVVLEHMLDTRLFFSIRIHSLVVNVEAENSFELSFQGLHCFISLSCIFI
jgi:hypothetical protein